MDSFVKSSSEALKKTLGTGVIHDAELQHICYAKDGRVRIETYNSFYKQKINFVFCDVKGFIATKGNWAGQRTTIVSLTVEEDFSLFLQVAPDFQKEGGDALYLLFQMLSGDEIHIAASEVLIETIPYH